MLEDRYGKIERDNRHLLKRMSGIMTRKGVFSTNNYKKFSRSLTYDGRKARALRITEDNQFLLHRLRNTTAYIKNEVLEKDFRRHRRIAQHLSEYGYPSQRGSRRHRRNENENWDDELEGSPESRSRRSQRSRRSDPRSPNRSYRGKYESEQSPEVGQDVILHVHFHHEFYLFSSLKILYLTIFLLKNKKYFFHNT